MRTCTRRRSLRAALYLCPPSPAGLIFDVGSNPYAVSYATVDSAPNPLHMLQHALRPKPCISRACLQRGVPAVARVYCQSLRPSLQRMLVSGLAPSQKLFNLLEAVHQLELQALRWCPSVLGGVS